MTCDIDHKTHGAKLQEGNSAPLTNPANVTPSKWNTVFKTKFLFFPNIVIVNVLLHFVSGFFLHFLHCVLAGGDRKSVV